jgi:hypothetical protein
MRFTPTNRVIIGSGGEVKKGMGKRSSIRCLKARETESMPLVTRTPMALEVDRRELTNRVIVGLRLSKE